MNSIYAAKPVVYAIGPESAQMAEEIAFLKKHGCRVTFFARHSELITALDHSQPDAILIDQLPQNTDNQKLYLRLNTVFFDIPLVIKSGGWTSQEHFFKKRKSGVDFLSVDATNDELLFHVKAMAVLQQQINQTEVVNRELEATKKHGNHLQMLLAHEIKGQIWNSKVIIQYLQTRMYAAGQMGLAQTCQRACESLRRTFTMLEALLLWSQKKLSSLYQEPALCNITALISRIIADQHFNCEARSLSTQINLLPETYFTISVRPTELALANIIGNAIKYSPAGGIVTIDGEITQAGLKLCVRDQGRGFEDKALSSIFMPGTYNVQHGTLGEKGTGLGLWLAAECLKMQGGWLKAENAPTGGAVLTLFLPADNCYNGN